MDCEPPPVQDVAVGCGEVIEVTPPPPSLSPWSVGGLRGDRGNPPPPLPFTLVCWRVER